MIIIIIPLNLSRPSYSRHYLYSSHHFPNYHRYIYLLSISYFFNIPTKVITIDAIFIVSVTIAFIFLSKNLFPSSITTQTWCYCSWKRKLCEYIYIYVKNFLVNGSPASTESLRVLINTRFQLFLGPPSQCISIDDSSLHLAHSSHFRYLFLLSFFLLPPLLCFMWVSFPL